MRPFLMGLALAIPLLGAEDRFLEWMDRIAQQQLSARETTLAAIHTTNAADLRKAFVRAKILELIGGLPDYNGPLNAKVTGRIALPRYTIEKVIFESLPQFYVTANLYRPNDAMKHPGILMPMGHWEEGKPAGQRIAANLALKGFVVLAYDPIGQGERLQAYDARLGASLAGGATEQHFMAGAQSILAGENFARYRIWDAKRALDYLVSRPEVEPAKIGCTGCSGGGTVTTYISALDPRIVVGAPACYINTWRQLFTGPTGDSEQSFPGFVAAGLDIPDYIELFAPKPYLIINTVGDFFPIEGARHAYQEALEWYRLYGADERIRWAVGPGGHGTPVEVREELYRWMIRWLLDGHGDPKEEPVEMQTEHALRATESGQAGGTENWQIILENFRRARKDGTIEDMVSNLRTLTGDTKAPPYRVVSESLGVKQIAVQTEPGLEIPASIYSKGGTQSMPAVLLVDGSETMAAQLAANGSIVLNLMPRGFPETASQGRLSGEWLANTRAWVIGRNLAGMRAGDIARAAQLLASLPGVDASHIRGIARGVSGVWLLMAASVQPSITSVWLDRTPYSLRAALETPIHRNLHDAVVPGFALHWDLADMVKSIAPRHVLWTDPTDWMGRIKPNIPGAVYRTFEEGDEPFLRRN
jgi:cephalosporin-C deacetylase-like acetyl esterase